MTRGYFTGSTETASASVKLTTTAERLKALQSRSGWE